MNGKQRRQAKRQHRHFVDSPASRRIIIERIRDNAKPQTAVAEALRMAAERAS